MAASRNGARRTSVMCRDKRICPGDIIGWLAATLILVGWGPRLAQAQSQLYSPVVLAPPVVDSIDKNHVSMLSGQEQFRIPALRMGDVSFTPYSVGDVFAAGQILDQNYGRIANCEDSAGNTTSGSTECMSLAVGIQVIYGQERGTFDLSAGQYSAEAMDGSTFVDNGSTCTWTQRDGTQIVYAAYHVSGNPLCQSNNIAEIITPDGRISTYYYYGSFSTTYAVQSPILSIATNAGYLLKYNYSGTPTIGGEMSVVAINRAFQACNPTALSCALVGAWPTATLSWATKQLSANCDNYGVAGNQAGCTHYIFTVQDESSKRHVFELDSLYRIISYQPPEATSPVYYYALCSLRSDNTLENCWTYTTWTGINSYDQTVKPLLLGWVYSATKVDNSTGNGATWKYGYNISSSMGQGYSVTAHSVLDPQQNSMSSSANTTGGGTYTSYGPVDSITQYDGTHDQYERNTRNYLSYQQTPLGMVTGYGYDARGNLSSITKSSIPGSNQGSVGESASYPPSCTNILTCNKPTETADFNGHSWAFTYDTANGEIWTETGPAVNGVQQQSRYAYAQRHAWYLSSSGIMTEDPNPILVLSSESYCMMGAAAPSSPGLPPPAPGSGCTQANDEVVTTYDYGPDSGPNNLLLRGKAVTAEGQTLRTCYAHDQQGDKISETSPNANLSSCPSY